MLISNSRGILVAATIAVVAREMMWKIMRSMPHANYDCVDYDALKLNEAGTLFAASTAGISIQISIGDT